MKFGQGGIREALQVDTAGPFQIVSLRFADDAGELCSADATDAPGLEGYGAGDRRVAEELRAVSGGRIGGDDKGIILLVPGKEARGTPKATLADCGDAQQVMAPK